MRFQLHARDWSKVGKEHRQRQYLRSVGMEFDKNGPITVDKDGKPIRLVIELSTLEQLLEFTETVDEECIVRAGYLEIYNEQE